MKIHSQNWVWRPAALVTTASLLLPTLAGCGGNKQETAAIPPPRDANPSEASRMAPAAAPTKAGMSTRKKVVIALVGAAALYYLYKRNQAKQNAPTNVQYYVSKSTGRIYYRDPQTHQAIWMTPAPAEVGTLNVDQSEVQNYTEVPTLQGYNNAPSGFGLDKYLQVQ